MSIKEIDDILKKLGTGEANEEDSRRMMDTIRRTSPSESVNIADMVYGTESVGALPADGEEPSVEEPTSLTPPIAPPSLKRERPTPESDAPDMYDSTGINEVVEDEVTASMERIGSNFTSYTRNSDFEIGGNFHNLLEGTRNAYTDPIARRTWARETSERSSKEIVQQMAKESYEFLADDVKAQYIGIVTGEMTKLNNSEATYFIKSRLGTPEGEAEIFSAMLDYTINEPTASKDLKQFYRQWELIKDKAEQQTTEEPFKIPKDLSNIEPRFAEALDRQANSAVSQLGNIRSAFSTYISDENISLSKVPFYRAKTLNLVADAFSKIDNEAILDENEILETRKEVLRSLQDYGSKEENFYLLSIEPGDLAAMKRYGGLRDLSTETFLQALMVTPADLRTYDEGHRGLSTVGSKRVLNKANQTWTYLGLSRAQQASMRRVIVEGSQTGISNSIAQVAKAGDELVADETAILTYIAELRTDALNRGNPWPPATALEIPSQLITDNVTNEFLMSQGAEPVDRRGWAKKGLSAVFGVGGDAVGGLMAADEYIIDGIAENVLQDADYDASQWGIEDDPYKQAEREALGIIFGGIVGHTAADYDKWAANQRRSGNETMALFFDAMSVMNAGEAKILGGIYIGTGGTIDVASIGASKLWNQNLKTGVGRLLPEKARKRLELEGSLITFEQIAYTVEKGISHQLIPGVGSQSWIEEFPELKDKGPFEVYSVLRNNMTHPDSKPGGKIRRDLVSIYRELQVAGESTFNDRQELEDAIGGILSYEQDPEDGMFRLKNAEEFIAIYNIRNENGDREYSIGEALDESIGMGERMRAGFAFGTFNLFDVFGGAAGKVSKAGFSAIKVAPRLKRVGSVSNQIVQYLGDATTLDLTDTKKAESYVSALRERAAAIKNIKDLELDEISVVAPKVSSLQETKRAIKAVVDVPKAIFRDPTVAQGADIAKPLQAQKGIDKLQEVKEGATLQIKGKQVPLVTETVKGVTGFGRRFSDNLQGRLTVDKGALPAKLTELEDELKMLEDAADLIEDGIRFSQSSVDVSRFDDIGNAVLRADQYIDTGGGIKDFFKITKALGRSEALQDFDVLKWKQTGKYGEHDLVHLQTDGFDGKPLLDRGFEATRWLRNKAFSATTEGAARDRIISNVYTTMNELGSMLGSLGPRFNKTLSDEHADIVFSFLKELQLAGKADDPMAYLLFLQKNKISGTLHAETAKSLDILKDIDLSKIESLKSQLGPSELNPKGLHPQEWWAKFNEEIKAQSQEVMLKRYNLTEEQGAALGLQNAINSFTSKLFLERPAFAMRNWVTNKSLMAIDGMNVGEMFLRSDAHHQNVWGDVEFAAKGFSSAALGADVTNLLPIRGQSKAWGIATGSHNEAVLKKKGWRRALRRTQGGGIPLIGGGVPFIFARELSGYAEAVDRMKIMDVAGARWYKQLASEQQITNLVQQYAPDAYRILQEGDGLLWKTVLEAIQDPNILDLNDVLNIVEGATDQAGVYLELRNSAGQFLRELGFDEISLAGTSKADEIVDRILNNPNLINPSPNGKGPLAAGYGLLDSLDEEIYKLLEDLRPQAITAGFDVSRNTNPSVMRKSRYPTFKTTELEMRIPQELPAVRGVPEEEAARYNFPSIAFTPDELERDLFSNTMELWDELFDSIKTYMFTGEGPLRPEQIKTAHDLTNQIVLEVVKPLRAIEEQKNLLLTIMQDKETYKSVQYGFVENLMKTGKVPQEEILAWVSPTSKTSFSKALSESDEQLAYNTLESLIRENEELISKDMQFLDNVNLGEDGLQAREDGEIARRILSEIRSDSLKQRRRINVKNKGDIVYPIKENLNKRIQHLRTTNLDTSTREGIMYETIIDILANDGGTRNLDAAYIRRTFFGKKAKTVFSNTDVEIALQKAIDNGDVFKPTKANKKTKGLEVRRTKFKGEAWKPMDAATLEAKTQELGEAMNRMADRVIERKFVKEDHLGKLRLFADDLAKDSRQLIQDVKDDAAKFLNDQTMKPKQRGAFSVKAAKEARENFIESVITRTQSKGGLEGEGSYVENSVTKLNELLEEIGLEPKTMDLRRKRNQQTMGGLSAEDYTPRTFPSKADENGQSVWHDQSQHAYDRIMLEKAPLYAFLKRWSLKVQSDLRSDGARFVKGELPEDSTAQFINNISSITEAQGRAWNGSYVDAELDADALGEFYDELEKIDPMHKTQEFEIGKDIRHRGLPRRNNWEDIRENAFNLENRVNLGTVISRNTEGGKRTASVPIMRMIIPRGQTEDLARSRSFSPAQRAKARTSSDASYQWVLRDPVTKGGKGDISFTGNEAVLPMNYGMDPQVRTDGTILKNVPPQGVHGRVPMQLAPEGYVPLITDDSWNVNGEGLNKLAVFIKKGASEKEIEEGIKKLAAYRDRLGADSAAVGWKLRQESRGTQNWTGFQASWSGSSGMSNNPLMTPAYAKAQLDEVIQEVADLSNKKSNTFKELKKQFNKKTAGNSFEYEVAVRRRSLKQLASYMTDQWDKGWPIYGKPDTSRSDLLELFVKEQKVFERARSQQRIRGGGMLGEQNDPFSVSSFYNNNKLLSEDEAVKITKALDILQVETNLLKRTAMKLAAANADWILHDYNNTSNLDYLIRWIGPWHIWQTRTAGKMAASVMENPKLLGRVSQYMQSLREINRDLDTSRYTSHDIPVGQALQPFFGMSKSLGADPGGWVSTAEHYSEGATLNVDAVMFWNDMFDYYPSGSDRLRAGEDPLDHTDEYTLTGKVFNAYSGLAKLPTNPALQAALVATGQYGDDVDKLEKIVGSYTRPMDTLLGLTANLTGAHHRTQVIRTNRDIREIDYGYMNAAHSAILSNTTTEIDEDGNEISVQSPDPNPETNEKLRFILMAWDIWSRKKKDNFINIPLLHMLGENGNSIFGHEMSDVDKAIDPLTGEEFSAKTLASIHADIVRESSSRRALQDTSSMLLGFAFKPGKDFAIDPKTGDKVYAADMMNGYYDIVRRRDLTEEEKSRRYKAFFEGTPWARNWLNNKKLQHNTINRAQAQSMAMAGFENIRSIYDEEVASIEGERIPIPAERDGSPGNLWEMAGLEGEGPQENEVFFKDLSVANIKKNKASQELKERIFEATGINTGLNDKKYGDIDPNFVMDKKTFGSTQLWQQLMREKLIKDDWFMTLFADNPMAGVQKVEDVLDELFKDGVYRSIKREDVEEVLKQISDEKFEKSGQRYNPEFISVDMFNAWQLETFVEVMREDRRKTAPALFSEEFEARDDFRVGGTNVIKWKEYFAALEEWETTMEARDPEQYRLYKIYEASNANLDSIVDKAIENVMRGIQVEINGYFQAGHIKDATALSSAVQAKMDAWKPPTVEDVMEWLETNEQGKVWRERQEYSQNEIKTAISARLDTTAGITFQDMKSGAWDEKITRLSTQFNRDVPFDEQYHFWAPNHMRVIKDAESLDEFKEAYEVHKMLGVERQLGQYLTLDTNNTQHRHYIKYFKTNPDQYLSLLKSKATLIEKKDYEGAALIQESIDELNGGGHLQGILGREEEGLNQPSLSDVDTPAKIIGKPTTGYPSLGSDPVNIGRKYLMYDLPRHPILSTEAENIKASLASRYYRGTQDLLPSNFIFETFARNGVSDISQIKDMWETLYPRLLTVYGAATLSNLRAINTLLGLTGANGIAPETAKIASFQYIDALAALVGHATGRDSEPQSKTRVSLPKSKWRNPSSNTRTASPTTSGVGGLPQWDEVSKHINMVFHDPDFETALTEMFVTPSKKLSRNHERMLRAMFRTFPVGSGYSFEQWVQALKLMYTTKEMLGLGSSNYNSYGGRSPTFKYPSKTPRFARYRD